jgi:TM2 domain-containing membrane protein YozV
MSTKEMLEFEKTRIQSEIIYEEKNLGLAYALWFFLGTFGAHRFYLGKIKTGIAFLVIAFLGWILLFIPYIVLGIWWLIDIYYVNKYVVEHNNEMRNHKLKILDKQISENEAENQLIANTEKVEKVNEIES